MLCICTIDFRLTSVKESFTDWMPFLTPNQQRQSTERGEEALINVLVLWYKTHSAMLHWRYQNVNFESLHWKMLCN